MSKLSMALIIALSLGAGVGLGVGGKSFGIPGLETLGVTAPKREARAPARRPNVPVQVTKIETSTFSDAIEAIGSLRARQSVNIVPEVAGRVEEILFRSGQKVQAGDLLLRLDDRNQRTAVEEAKAALSEALHAYERTQSLMKNRVATQATLEQTQAAYLRAQAAVDRAEHALADRRITAPFDGVIGLNQTDIGAWIDTTTVLTTLDDLSGVEVEFSVPEKMLPRVSVGQVMTATSDAYPGRSFEGTVKEIDTRINPSSRAFAMRAVIPNPDLALKQGMFVNIRLVLDQRTASALPEEAVLTAGRETYVFTLNDGKAVRKAVQLGARHGGLVEVVEGLQPGQSVISSGTQTLTDGVSVEVMNKNVAEVRTRAGS
ncbi:membrane fusion protein (multidrug efflux system) [Rhodoligotrophos appendicifer]|uniref:efflux RND transporter periplasmic adaptor subunit n=1 Tax=Rhodoligotrophos appendicifer TaxID=987056 RepID=UPI00117DDCF9|nr:efflux RND transporter periplasmic adaptor subunit [Rhodoligotrophos appendicifer]